MTSDYVPTKWHTRKTQCGTMVKLFNELTPAIKEEQNLERFKETIFIWLKQRFPVVSIYNRLYIIKFM
jgi:hypothetical protein